MEFEEAFEGNILLQRLQERANSLLITLKVNGLSLVKEE